MLRPMIFGEAQFFYSLVFCHKRGKFRAFWRKGFSQGAQRGEFGGSLLDRFWELHGWKLLKISQDKQTRVLVKLDYWNSLIWANYRSKYVSEFNDPLFPIINIILYLSLGCETNFKGKRISLYPRSETKRHRIVLGTHTLWLRPANWLLLGSFTDKFHSG